MITKITKYTHACVRLESPDAVIVIDPGNFTERAALDGVDAVLITHEHADHLDVDALADELGRRPAVRVFTHRAVRERLGDLAEAVTEISSGERFTAAGFAVQAYGGWHAEIHPDIVSVPNLGFLVDDSLYHPGDSFDVPVDVEIETLFVPISGPWVKLADSVSFVRAIAPRRAFALHDCLLSDAGVGIYDKNMTRLVGDSYSRLRPGETIEVNC